MTAKVKILKKENVADGTLGLWLEKPAGFDFQAGQHLDLSLIDPPETDEEGNGRDLSIASAPSEQELLLATRIRDTAFKRVLANLPVGGQVNVRGPMGTMYLIDNPSGPLVFLAGGIGITPFRSMIVEATTKQSPQEIYLFYSNRTPPDAAFLSELQELTGKNPHFHLVAAMTQDDSWSGEKGYLTAETLRKYLPDLSMPIYFLAGPPTFTQAISTMLASAGVSPTNIRSEEFEGY